VAGVLPSQAIFLFSPLPDNTFVQLFIDVEAVGREITNCFLPDFMTCFTPPRRCPGFVVMFFSSDAVLAIHTGASRASSATVLLLEEHP